MDANVYEQVTNVATLRGIVNASYAMPDAHWGYGFPMMKELAEKEILIRSPSPRGVAEEAPGAYKDVTAVVDAADAAGLSKKVARLEPLVCIKG